VLLPIPLYGLTEAPSYWWLCFADYHLQQLGCRRTLLDPCVFYKPHSDARKGCKGSIGTFVDDTIGASDEEFLAHEEETSVRRLDVKARNVQLFDFAGCRVEQFAAKTALTYEDYMKDLAQLLRTSCFKDLQVAPGKLAWIAHAWPDVSVSRIRLAQLTASSFDVAHLTLHNKVRPRQGKVICPFYPGKG
jgi:hypothetical protein